MRGEGSHGALMDRVYRRQRHIYNLTRRYYLLGRDDLIRGLDLRPGDRVVEIGCGTARNLIAIANRFPGALLFGLDASGEMLGTAADSVSRAALSKRITLRLGMAEDLSPELFGESGGFDCAMFSYSLSMIPGWRSALAAASRVLTENGRIHIVDFGDFAGLPGPVSAVLRAWLRKFHVVPRAELLGELERTDAADRNLHIYPGRYAFRWNAAKAPGSALANVAGAPQAAEIS